MQTKQGIDRGKDAERIKENENRGREGRNKPLMIPLKTQERKGFLAPPSQTDEWPKRGKMEENHSLHWRQKLPGQWAGGKDLETYRLLFYWLSHLAFQSDSIPNLLHPSSGKGDKCNLKCQICSQFFQPASWGSWAGRVMLDCKGP